LVADCLYCSEESCLVGGSNQILPHHAQNQGCTLSVSKRVDGKAIQGLLPVTLGKLCLQNHSEEFIRTSSILSFNKECPDDRIIGRSSIKNQLDALDHIAELRKIDPSSVDLLEVLFGSLGDARFFG
jgi:hypothetical protein